jgi:voltage-gated potassium channel
MHSKPNLKSKLAEIVNNVNSPWGSKFALAIQALIIYSLITFSISTLPDLSKRTITFLDISRYITVSIFTIEYILRVYVAKNKWSYVTSVYGLIDLAAILPFYLSLTIDLRSFRILRVLRLFRILKVARYNQALQRFRFVFREIKEQLIIFFTATVLLLYITAVGIYYFENAVQPENFSSIFHSLWWAVATLTTVGYGDVYPITSGGKIFTFFVLMIGLGMVSAPAGFIASAFSKAYKKDSKNTDEDLNK